MNRLINKLAFSLDVHPNQLTFGGVRDQMASDLLKTLTEVINRKSDHESVYYILVTAKLDPSCLSGNIIKETIILLDIVPPKMLGTLLFRVDNKNADAEMVWNLPLDLNLPWYIEKTKAKTDVIKKSASGMPIINSRLN